MSNLISSQDSNTNSSVNNDHNCPFLTPAQLRSLKLTQTAESVKADLQGESILESAKEHKAEDSLLPGRTIKENKKSLGHAVRDFFKMNKKRDRLVSELETKLQIMKEKVASNRLQVDLIRFDDFNDIKTPSHLINRNDFLEEKPLHLQHADKLEQDANKLESKISKLELEVRKLKLSN